MIPLLLNAVEYFKYRTSKDFQALQNCVGREVRYLQFNDVPVTGTLQPLRFVLKDGMLLRLRFDLVGKDLDGSPIPVAGGGLSPDDMWRISCDRQVD